MYLDVMNGRIVCPDCRGDYEREKRNSDEDETADIYLKILPDVLEAMRYIVYSDQRKMLAFSLNPEAFVCVRKISCESDRARLFIS